MIITKVALHFLYSSMRKNDLEFCCFWLSILKRPKGQKYFYGCFYSSLALLINYESQVLAEKYNWTTNVEVHYQKKYLSKEYINMKVHASEAQNKFSFKSYNIMIIYRQFFKRILFHFFTPLWIYYCGW